jgi:long-subunit fatty acid transport protein
VNSATFAVKWTDKLGTYYEVFTKRELDTGLRWIASFDTGVTYALTPNIQLDAGINLGLTKAADDYSPFIGITYRY